MSDTFETGDTPEAAERHFSPAELLERYDIVGEKARKRFEADHSGTPSYDLAKDIQGIFPLSTGARAQFGWDESPIFYRPERRLPSGALVVKSGKWGEDEHADQYLFQRYIHGERVSASIVYFEYDETGQSIDGTEQLFDQDKYRQIDSVLSEIEAAIENPDQAIEWHRYGATYIW